MISLLSLSKENQPYIEEFEQLAENIDLKYNEKQILVIHSSQSGEGKSTIAANLALTYAKQGLQTLLIDANLERPSQATLFAKRNYKGLTNYLSGEESDLQRLTLPSDLIRTLDLLTSGPKRELEGITENKVKQLLVEAQQYYRRIIVDTASLNRQQLSLLFAEEAKLNLLVLRDRFSEKKPVYTAFKKLKSLPAPVALIENEFSD